MNHEALLDKALGIIPYAIGGYIIYTIVKNSMKGAKVGGP